MTFAQRVGRGLVWNQASRVIELGAAYVASVVVARALGAVDFGVYSVALSIVTLTYYSTSLGMNEVLNVHVPRLAASPGQAAFLLRALLRLRTLIAFALAVGLFVLAPVIARLWHTPALEAVLQAAALYAFFYNVSLLLEYFLMGALQVPRVARARITVQLLNLAAAAAALRFHWHARTLFLVMAGSAALGVAWLVWGARRPLRTPGEAFDLGALRRFGLALWVTNLFGYFLGRQSDVLLIGYFRPGTDEAGCYAAATLLSMLFASGLLMGTEGVSLAAFSELDQRVERGSVGRLWNLHLKMDLLLSVPLLVIGAALAPRIIAVLYDAGFGHAAPMLAAYAAVWCLVRFSGGGTNMTVLYAMNQPRLPLLIYGISGAFNLAANLILVQRWGALGAIVGTGLAMVGSSIASGLLVMRRTGGRLPFALALKLLVASAPALLVLRRMPHLAGPGGLAVEGAAGLTAFALAVRLLRPLDPFDRRLLTRLNPRLRRLVSWL